MAAGDVLLRQAQPADQLELRHRLHGGNNLVGYDAIGNILGRPNLGTYSYPTPGLGAVRPHAVTSIATPAGSPINGVNNPTFQYDANGNMTSGAGRTVAWTSFNMAGSVTSNGSTLALTYDSEHQRIKQCVPDCTSPQTTTIYLNDGATGAMAERYSNNGVTWRTMIVADGKLVAERIVDPDSTVHMRYFVLDHLGSVAAIADEGGAVLKDSQNNETGRFSYDPWGRMRKLNGAADTTCMQPQNEATNSGGVTRGYTSQEEMPSVCLVNYNARLYDPWIGKFISADPTIEAPYNGQDLNRYAYVGNNALAFTDPSGLCFLGCFWKNPIFVAIVSIAIAIFVPYALAGFSMSVFTAGTLTSIAEVAAGGALAGAISAGLTGGNVLKGALFGGLTAAAFAGAGALAGDLGLVAQAGEAATAGQIIGNMALHGMVGGLINTAEGGNFFSGFLAAGVGSLGGALSGGQFDVGKMFISAALGGVASVLGGGKFQNGAITGAFAYAATSLAANDPPDATVNKCDSGPYPVRAWAQNGTVTIEYSDGTLEIRGGGSLAWRDNNPGNIEAGDFANSEGAIGANGRFAIFPDYTTGQEAMLDLLQTPSYQGLTLQQAIARWAPPVENNTEAYANYVSGAGNIPLGTPMSSLSSPQLNALGSAIQMHEGFVPGTITNGFINLHLGGGG